MSHRADPRFLFELKIWDGKYRILFQLWQLVLLYVRFPTEEENFPRRMIRYTQIGMKEKLLS